MPIQQTLGQRMAQKRREKAAREHRDITQVDVAKAVGVSKAAISKYESDTDRPRDSVLNRIAAFLDTTPEFLRYGVPAAGPFVPPAGAELTTHPRPEAASAAPPRRRGKAGGDR